jgi:hypothetical protein
MERIGVEEIPKAKKALGVLKKLMEIVEMEKVLKKVGIAIAVSMVVSLVIPSILPKIPAELVAVAVGGAASLVTLTVADLKKLLRKMGR